MTLTPDDGGPAFPMAVAAKPDGDTVSSHSYGIGMSLRDWFAGQAIDHMILLSQDKDGGWDPANVAAGCYALADAMLEARKP